MPAIDAAIKGAAPDIACAGDKWIDPEGHARTYATEGNKLAAVLSQDAGAGREVWAARLRKIVLYIYHDME